MSSLLETKEYIKRIYAKNEVYITPVLKLLLAIVVFATMNAKIGYMQKLASFVVVLVVALFCSFMPTATIAILASLFMIAHYYALSLECAIVVMALFVVMFLLYARFVPKETVVILLTPILFALKIPYMMPIVVGLLGGPMSIISVTFGVIISCLVQYTEINVATITSMDTETMVARLRFIIDGLIGNKAMVVMVIAFAVTVMVVYFIRRSSMDYAWTVAIVAGALTDVFILMMGDLFFDLEYSILGVLLGSIVSALLCFVVQFLFFNVDYTRTEKVQFEDDEYYYYVKAVPKISVAAPDKKVKKINTKREGASRPNAAPTTIKTAHGVSRATSERRRSTDDIVKK